MRHLTGPRDIRFWAAIGALVAAGIAFAIIAASVATTAPILKQDLQVSVYLHTHGNPVFTAFLVAITQLHSPLGMTIMAALLGVWLWREKHHYWTLSLALAVPGGMLINTIIKYIFHRDRPVWDDPLFTLSSASFPSGHTAGATLFYGFIAAFMVWNMKTLGPRLIAVTGCALMVALVGFSRIYLGVHYLSDVLAAMSVAIVWLVICLISVRGLAHRRGAA
ncbi:MAG TPA: phosphatase PAP2 family protein [Usitatibacter sp.]|nr:phosphatase PAP2 family protein [Usitatibacter sp.]